MNTLKEKPQYTPISEDASSQSEHESDDFLFEGGFSTTGRTVSQWKRRILVTLGALVFLISYTAVTISITSMYWKKERLHGASVIDC